MQLLFRFRDRRESSVDSGCRLQMWLCDRDSS
jgi:hypothetical protein